MTFPPLNRFDSILAARLMLTFAHFLWQGLAIGVLAWYCTAAMGRASSRIRYGAFVAALLLMAACPVGTFFLVDPPTREPVGGSSVNKTNGESQPAIAGTVSRPHTESSEVAVIVPAERGPEVAAVEAGVPDSSQEKPAFAWQAVAPYAVAVYLLGVLLLFTRLLLGLHGGWNLRRQSEAIADPYLLDAIARRAKALGFRAVPAVGFCRNVTIPTVVGMIRPAVLLPASFATGLTADQIDAILTHELAHIRRFDHLVNLLQRVIESLLFFHPAIWWVSRCIRVERENCCDDVVVALGAERLSYAESLLNIAARHVSPSQRPAHAVATLSATGRMSQLGQRIHRLIGAPAPYSLRLTRGGIAALLTAAALATFGSIYFAGQADATGSEKANDEKKADKEQDKAARNGFEPAETTTLKPGLEFLNLHAGQRFATPIGIDVHQRLVINHTKPEELNSLQRWAATYGVTLGLIDAEKDGPYLQFYGQAAYPIKADKAEKLWEEMTAAEFRDQYSYGFGILNFEEYGMIPLSSKQLPATWAVVDLGLLRVTEFKNDRVTIQIKRVPPSPVVGDWSPPTKVADGTGWRVRLRSKKSRWLPTETPTFSVDLRNDSDQVFVYPDMQELTELELDGQWYRWGEPVIIGRPVQVVLKRARKLDAFKLTLVNSWRESRRPMGPRLKATPGRHRVRVAVTVSSPGRRGRSVRLVSGSVTVEIAEDNAKMRDQKPHAFGPVVERIVGFDIREKDAYLDLETGEHVAHDPLDRKATDRDALKRIDIATAAAGSDTRVRHGWHMVVVPVDKGRWDATVDEVRKAVEEAKPKERFRFGVPPRTYFIKTREGSIGILQIIGITEMHEGVTIRYKLVRKTGKKQAAKKSKENAGAGGPDPFGHSVAAVADWFKRVSKGEVDGWKNAAGSNRVTAQDLQRWAKAKTIHIERSIASDDEMYVVTNAFKHTSGKQLVLAFRFLKPKDKWTYDMTVFADQPAIDKRLRTLVKNGGRWLLKKSDIAGTWLMLTFYARDEWKLVAEGTFTHTYRRKLLKTGKWSLNGSQLSLDSDRGKATYRIEWWSRSDLELKLVDSDSMQFFSTKLFRDTRKPVSSPYDAAPPGVRKKPAAPRGVEREAKWGKAVDGVQVSLRAKRTEWKAKDVPEFLVDVRNRGKLNLLVHANTNLCELEVDGEWYVSSAETLSYPGPFPPGRRYNDIRISAADSWHHKPTFKALDLAPGKHRIRIAFLFPGNRKNGAPGNDVRALSNPVEIEVLNPEGDGEEAGPDDEKASTAARETKKRRLTETQHKLFVGRRVGTDDCHFSS